MANFEKSIAAKALIALFANNLIPALEANIPEGKNDKTSVLKIGFTIFIIVNLPI